MINASPLHMGILSPGGKQEWHTAQTEVKFAGRPMAAVCRARGKNIAEVALHFAMNGPDIATTLCGMRTQAEVKSNLTAYRTAPGPLLIAELHALAAPHQEPYLARRLTRERAELVAWPNLRGIDQGL